MESAFGVDHGEFGKSWKKLAPKLAAAEKGLTREGAGGAKDMYRKLRYIKGREDLGQMRGTQKIFPNANPKAAKRIKTRMQADQYRRTNEPKKRVLP